MCVCFVCACVCVFFCFCFFFLGGGGREEVKGRCLWGGGGRLKVVVCVFIVGNLWLAFICMYVVMHDLMFSNTTRTLWQYNTCNYADISCIINSYTVND